MHRVIRVTGVLVGATRVMQYKMSVDVEKEKDEEGREVQRKVAVSVDRRVKEEEAPVGLTQASVCVTSQMKKD